ncbi:MAG TPA: DUF3368 domain-containing protein [Nitrospiraceae bacterium]|nr:DUF3368 domain-containing protein [Nitrospiraceae bacterium]
MRTPTQIASPPGVRCRPAEGARPLALHARLEGIIDRLQPVLDQLMAFGLYLDPARRVYQEALRRVQER